MTLDRFDRLILSAVQADASLTSEQLAQRIPLSASAIQRRLRRLKDERVILRETAVLDARKLGGFGVYIASLQVERERPELLARLRAWLAACDQIQQAYYVTGDADFVLVVTAPDPESFDQLMAALVAENPNVRRFTTNVMLSLVKRSLDIPVRLDS